eukprot:scaffold16511_cov67-Cyclotella_meneghiniana.AAC.6
MNVSNRLILLLFVIVLVLFNYYQLLSRHKSGVDISFDPPVEKLQVHNHNSSRNDGSLSIEDIANRFNLTIPNPQASGRLAPQRRNGTRYNSPIKYQDNGDHWWTYTDSCFAVDHICRISRNRWFYFQNSSIDDESLRTNAKGRWQPSFELKYMPYSYRRGLFANTLMQMSTSSSHQISWEEISDLCIIDAVHYHIVLQSLFNVSPLRVRCSMQTNYCTERMAMTVSSGYDWRILQPHITIHAQTTFSGPNTPRNDAWIEQYNQYNKYQSTSC